MRPAQTAGLLALTGAATAALLATPPPATAATATTTTATRAPAATTSPVVAADSVRCGPMKFVKNFYVEKPFRTRFAGWAVKTDRYGLGKAIFLDKRWRDRHLRRMCKVYDNRGRWKRTYTVNYRHYGEETGTHTCNTVWMVSVSCGKTTNWKWRQVPPGLIRLR